MSRGNVEVGLDPDHVWCDVAAFERAIAEGDRPAAIKLYRGDMLKGFYVQSAPAFERWLDTERLRLSSLFTNALEELAGEATAAGNARDAHEYRKQLVFENPFDSKRVMRLMEALVAFDDRAHALLCAQQHIELLNAELGLEPPADFIALVNQIQQEGSAASGQSGSAVAQQSEKTSGGVSKMQSGIVKFRGLLSRGEQP
jgi:DNA-binding SARP family transcriptional activator